MNIREATAMVVLYRACAMGTTTRELRAAARKALEYLPDLAVHGEIKDDADITHGWGEFEISRTRIVE